MSHSSTPPPQFTNSTNNKNSSSPSQLIHILSTILADNESLSKDMAPARAPYERAEQTLALPKPLATSATATDDAGQIIEPGKHKQLPGSFTDQINMISGLPASGGAMEQVCMYQIDDTTPGPFEGPTMQDIDATPPQDTGQSLAAASAALVAETSIPAQAAGISPQSAPSLEVPVAGTGTQVDGHPVAFSTADFGLLDFQGGSSDEDDSALQSVPLITQTPLIPEVGTPGCRSSLDPVSYAEFYQQAQETSDSPGRSASGFIPDILNLGSLRRGTSSVSRYAPRRQLTVMQWQQCPHWCGCYVTCDCFSGNEKAE
jgi:hypothetical protein